MHDIETVSAGEMKTKKKRQGVLGAGLVCTGEQREDGGESSQMRRGAGVVSRARGRGGEGRWKDAKLKCRNEGKP